jgi:hypothetical protein
MVKYGAKEPIMASMPGHKCFRVQICSLVEGLVPELSSHLAGVLATSSVVGR